MNKLLKIFGSIFVSILFLTLLLKSVNVESIVQDIESFDKIYLIGAIAVFIAGYMFRTKRWLLMLSIHNQPPSFLKCAHALFVSVAVNNVVPLRAGDALRAFGFNKFLGISTGTSLSSLMAERILDLVVLTFVLGLVLLVAPEISWGPFEKGGWMFLGVSAILTLGLVFSNKSRAVVDVVVSIICKIKPAFAEKISKIQRDVFDSLNAYSKRGLMLKLIGYSLLAWVAEGAVFYLVALGLAEIANPDASLMAFPIGTISTMIPSSPGYVGTFDYFVVKAMTFLGNAESSAAAFAVIVHFIIWAPPIVLGGLSLLIVQLKKLGYKYGR